MKLIICLGLNASRLVTYDIGTGLIVGYSNDQGCEQENDWEEEGDNKLGSQSDQEVIWSPLKSRAPKDVVPFVVQMTKSCLIDTLAASPAPYSFTVKAGHLVLRVSLVGNAEALRACIRQFNAAK